MIGKKIKEYRLALKLTGETLSSYAGIKRSYLSQIENEKKIPPMETFMNLVKAIAYLSPITIDNEYEVLTEDGYEEFSKLLKVDIEYIQSDIPRYSINVYHGKTIIYSDTEEIDKEDFDDPYIPSKADVLDEIISEKYFYWRSDISEYNLLELEQHKDKFPLAYHDENVIHSLFIWWQNAILGDIFYTATGDIEDDDDDKKIELNDNELDLIFQIGALRNQSGEFAVDEKDDTTNFSKELLYGRTIIFDLRSIHDKNIKLLLDGSILSAKELEMLNVSLGAIRYARLDK